MSSALERVAQASQAVASTRNTFIRAIFEAKQAGETHQDIADAAGLSRQRIAQILKDFASITEEVTPP